LLSEIPRTHACTPIDGLALLGHLAFAQLCVNHSVDVFALAPPSLDELTLFTAVIKNHS
jgi:hypothetical protein